jgi:ABC-type multidrug transport system ATPase subunit
VRLESVGKRYGLRQPWIVREVSLDVPAGRLIRLEGRNGSGKSTLLRVAAGVSAPSAGRVTGRPHTGYVPERFPGDLAFCARDYLLHMGRVHGLRGAQVSGRADEWLDRLGATDYAGSPLRSLSKGMCQKVAIAQALMSRPGLLVLDEAWTGLDQAARGALDAAVAQRVTDGGSVIFVDHDQARLAGQVSDRWQLDGGGQVKVTGPASPPPPPVADDVVLIELSGLEGDSLVRLDALAGVLSWSAGERAGLVLRVAAGESDGVLRQLLATDGVHVLTVRTEAGTAR